MVECNPVDIPADPNNPVTAEMSPKTEQERRNMQKTPVREAIGSLMYLMAMTRGDIAYAVNQVAAFVSDPGQGHWNAIKTILAYLSGTVHHGIFFGGKGISDKSILVGFTDADFAADIVKRKSTTGMVFLFFGGAVSWGTNGNDPGPYRQPTPSSTLRQKVREMRYGSKHCWMNWESMSEPSLCTVTTQVREVSSKILKIIVEVNT